MCICLCELSHFLHVMIQHALTVVYFLAEHDQQHIVVGRKQLVDPGSFKQGAENLQQLRWAQHKTVTGRKSSWHGLDFNLQPKNVLKKSLCTLNVYFFNVLFFKEVSLTLKVESRFLECWKARLRTVPNL